MPERPSIERLREAFNYDPVTGTLTNKITRGFRALAGDVAGNAGVYHRHVRVDYLRIVAHVIAFALMVGRYPTAEIDHINGDGFDNRWSNLREASRLQNTRNTRVRRHNKLGLKGVNEYKPGKFAAFITLAGKSRYLGTFRTAPGAAKAYDAAATLHFGAFARTNASPPPN